VLDRRHFLSATTGLAATLALRSPLLAQLEKAPANLPDHSLLDKNEDAYWAELRQQFLIPADEIYLNNGTVGSSPAPVLRAIFDGYNTTEKMDQQDPEDYPIWGYDAWNQFRDPLAAFVGCKRDEIALLRNATEANSYIANGIDLKPGDEVLMTDQEHPGGEHPWNQGQALWHCGKKSYVASSGKERRASAQSLQRCHHSSDARHLLQPHHDVLRSDLTGERTVRFCPIERNTLGRRWRSCPGHDAPQRARHWLRHVFSQSA